MLKVAVPFLDRGTLDRGTLALFDSSQQREAENRERIERLQPLLIMTESDAASWIKTRLCPDFYAVQVCAYKLEDARG